MNLNCVLHQPFSYSIKQFYHFEETKALFCAQNESKLFKWHLWIICKQNLLLNQRKSKSLSRIVRSNFLLVFTTSFLAWYLLLFSYFSLQILSGLYIGNFRDSKDAKQLDLYKITHILSIHDEARKLFKAISVFVPFCSHYVYLRKHHSRNRWWHWNS